MPDIFLSYSRADQAIASRFAEELGRAGFSVWWDQTLNAGEDYDKVTEQALESARAVVVLWSRNSVDSRWVRAEATQADRSGTLVPAMIEPCKRPIMFELKQTADLSGWTGDPNDKTWQGYLASVRRLVEKDTPPAAIAIPPVPVRPRRYPGVGVAIAVLALVVVAAGMWVASRKGGAPAIPATSADVAAASEVTLAVLPFANLSSDPEQEYFSDGMTEEVLNQLAQISALRVTGRTSSFSFKGKNEDLRIIGQKLGVANLLEGSIRKDGNKLRITAQLINSRDGTHLWSQTYDRELKDVFSIQEDIARDVARALSIKLDVSEMNRAQGGTTNLPAYDKFLHAQTAYRRLDLVEAARLYREATALDPMFWRAWFGLRSTLNAIPNFNPERADEARREMTEVRAHLAEFAPDSWAKQIMLAAHHLAQLEWVDAAAAMKAAEWGMPASEVDGRLSMSLFHSTFGYNAQALAQTERAVRLDPQATLPSWQLQGALLTAGRHAEAKAEFGRGLGLSGAHGPANGLELSRMLLAGDLKAAREFIRSNSAEFGRVPAWTGLLEKLDSPPAERRAVFERTLRDPANQTSSSLSWLLPVAGYFGGPEAVVDVTRRIADLRDFTVIGHIWEPASGRADPRFKEILKSTGLVDYYRLTGRWADFCKPIGTDDFECH